MFLLKWNRGGNSPALGVLCSVALDSSTQFRPVREVGRTREVAKLDGIHSQIQPVFCRRLEETTSISMSHNSKTFTPAECSKPVLNWVPPWLSPRSHRHFETREQILCSLESGQAPQTCLVVSRHNLVMHYFFIETAELGLKFARPTLFVGFCQHCFQLL